MPEAELSLLFVRPLNLLGIRYIISGSVAAILYGEPRMTHDVDFVVSLSSDNIRRLSEAFSAPSFYLPPVEVMAIEVARPEWGHFIIINLDTGFKADFYTSGRDDLHAWAFRHARRLEYLGERMSVAPPEYVIIRKLEYFREGGSEKHLRDIRAMVEVSRDLIDRKILDDWVREKRVEAEWAQAIG